MTREEFKDWYDRLSQYFDNEVAMDTIVQTVRVEVNEAEIPSFVGHLERSVRNLQESKQTFDLRRADHFLDLIRTLAQP